MSMHSIDLTDHFLIAMPSLEDPNFFHSVTYVCEHTNDGAMGIIINQPTPLSLQALLAHMDIDAARAVDLPVYQGGPIQQERGFILHRADHSWTSTLRVSDAFAITTSRDILEALARGEGPSDCLVALGYAGWGAGQLEREISDNAWLTCPADADVVFRQPAERRWHAAAGSMGVDLGLISGQAGHA